MAYVHDFWRTAEEKPRARRGHCSNIAIAIAVAIAIAIAIAIAMRGQGSSHKLGDSAVSVTLHKSGSEGRTDQAGDIAQAAS